MNALSNTPTDVNVAVVTGILTSDPRTRTLPSGSVVINYELTTKSALGERASVPVSWVDPSRPPSMKTGDRVTAVGMISRRFFRAGGSTQSRTELLANLVVRPGAARAGKAIAAALAPLR